MDIWRELRVENDPNTDIVFIIGAGFGDTMCVFGAKLALQVEFFDDLANIW